MKKKIITLVQKNDFYNKYHIKNSRYFKVINDNNVTYFYILPIIKQALGLLKNKKEVVKGIDVGCGVGTLAFYLALRNVNMEAYDVSLSAINICNEYKKYSGTSNVHFHHKDVEKISPSKKYDLLLCTEVIEHLADDVKFLKKLKSVSHNGSILVLSTPSTSAPLYKLGFLKTFDREVGHLRRYDEVALKKLLEENGFQVIKLVKTEGLLRNLLFTVKPFGLLLKVIKGPLVPFFHAIDNIAVKLFGESDLIVLARSK